MYVQYLRHLDREKEKEDERNRRREDEGKRGEKVRTGGVGEVGRGLPVMSSAPVSGASLSLGAPGGK